MEIYLKIIGGLIFLFLGGEILIKGAISAAHNLNISKILVSSVIVGFGTSMPEMVVSIDAILRDAPEIAIGNVVGSNIANILLITGIAIIIRPFLKYEDSFKKDIYVLVLATTFICFLSIFGGIKKLAGFLMISSLIAYITYSYNFEKKNFNENQVSDIESDLGVFKNLSLIPAILLAIAGIIVLVLGSSLFISGSVMLAEILGVSKEIIGLGIVAVGSSLPELATSVVAAYRKHIAVIIASVLGSNIFNILSISSISAIIGNLYYPQRLLDFDLWFMLITTLYFCYKIFFNKSLTRYHGISFVLIYFIYFYILF